MLITPADLAALQATGSALTILDVRYRLDAPDGREAHRSGHVPGAVYVSLDDELSRHGRPDEGRHPLPEPHALRAAARRWGLDAGDTVVLYDDWQSMAAARAWWVLTDAGVRDVRILDGGWGAWCDAGMPIAVGEEAAPAPGDAVLAPGHRAHLSIDDAAALPGTGLLLDVRAPERYRGEVEPLDPIAGHIPGAVNAPAPAVLDERGRFLPVALLRERFAALGVDGATAVGAYCGSGVTASHTVFALNLAGIDAALYPGSWSQWSNTPGRPVASGPEA